MSNPALQTRSRRSRNLLTATLVLVAACTGAALSRPESASSTMTEPVLVGRAILPARTLAEGPPAGAFVTPSTMNGVTFPLPSQPVQGFSAVVSGGRPGKYLAMADNGFGAKANSRDFLIRAYHLRPDFKTPRGGSGEVEVGEHVSFRDPDGRIGFPIVNEGTADRLLTGGDIDPESLQRGRHGDLWVGDEFGPWILHFDRTGRLLDPPISMPGGLMSPNNPFLGSAPSTQPNSRGIEGMAITPNRKYLYAALEGATVADTDRLRRYIFEYSTTRDAFTGRVAQYHTELPANLVADMWALDRHRLVVIERDLGSGLSAVFRRVYLVDLRRTDAAGFLVKTQLVDLTAVPDPHLVSLPETHPGDLGLGDPFWVMCESAEAVHLVRGNRLLVGCDNNFPNSGRNPGLPDDNELILVDVPGLRSRG
jgi:glycerophosphoryl diester phosphodiesterase